MKCKYCHKNIMKWIEKQIRDEHNKDCIVCWNLIEELKQQIQSNCQENGRTSQGLWTRPMGSDMRNLGFFPDSRKGEDENGN